MFQCNRKIKKGILVLSKINWRRERKKNVGKTTPFRMNDFQLKIYLWINGKSPHLTKHHLKCFWNGKLIKISKYRAKNPILTKIQIMNQYWVPFKTTTTEDLTTQCWAKRSLLLWKCFGHKFNWYGLPLPYTFVEDPI